MDCVCIVEPNPQYHKGLLENRRCVLIKSPVSSTSNDLINDRGIVDEDQDNSNTFRGNDHMLYTAPLAAVFIKAPHIIDYMSLDIEGGKYFVLEHFDLALHDSC